MEQTVVSRALRRGGLAMSVSLLSIGSKAATLQQWDESTLYVQQEITNSLLDSVSFSVEGPGNVGVAVAIRSWTYSTTWTTGTFWAELANADTGVQIASRDGHFIPNVGGVYFINPTFLQVGNYKAIVSLNLPGTGVAEIDVISYIAPHARLTPVQSIPEPDSTQLALSALAVMFGRFALGNARLGVHRRLLPAYAAAPVQQA